MLLTFKITKGSHLLRLNGNKITRKTLLKNIFQKLEKLAGESKPLSNSSKVIVSAAILPKEIIKK